MESTISNRWYLVLIKGIIMILLALLILMSPGEAMFSVVLWLGLGLIVTGVLRIGQGFSLKNENTGWGWIALEGVLDLFVGFIFLIHPGLSESILPFIIGFWAAFYGLFLIVDAFSGNGSLAMKLIAGILIVILGNLIIFNPIAAGFTLVIWTGITLLFIGIYNVLISFSLK